MSMMEGATTDCLPYLPAKSYGLVQDMLPVSFSCMNVPEIFTASPLPATFGSGASFPPVGTGSNKYPPPINAIQQMFVNIDINKDGLVSRGSFSKLIDMAASISRMYGYAPIDTELYKTEDGKEQARRKMFNSMNLGGTGVITIDEWSKFYVEYVIAKAALVIGSPELTEDIREGGEKGERTTEHGNTVHLYSAACYNY